MKRFLLCTVFATVCAASGAQDRVGAYAAQLRTAEPRTGARIEVNNDAEVATGLRLVAPNGQTVGYRICIFFDNKQNGRSLANEALESFRNRFPEIPGEVVYDNPTFKTMVGYCVDMNEASMLLGRVREFFSNAVIRTETLSIAQLRQSPVLTGMQERADSVEMPAERILLTE